jgi:hypothetical protein
MAVAAQKQPALRGQQGGLLEARHLSQPHLAIGAWNGEARARCPLWTRDRGLARRSHRSSTLHMFAHMGCSVAAGPAYPLLLVVHPSPLTKGAAREAPGPKGQLDSARSALAMRSRGPLTNAPRAAQVTFFAASAAQL